MKHQFETGDFVVFQLPAPSGGFYAYTGTIEEVNSLSYVIVSQNFEYAESIMFDTIIGPEREERAMTKKVVDGEEVNVSTGYTLHHATVAGRDTVVGYINPLGDHQVSAFVVPKENVLMKLPSELKDEKFVETVDELLERILSNFSFYKIITRKEFDNWVYTDPKTQEIVKVKKKEDIPRQLRKSATRVPFSFGMAVEVSVKWVVEFDRGRKMVYNEFSMVPDVYRDRVVRKVIAPSPKQKNQVKVFWSSDRLYDSGMVWASQPSSEEINIGDLIAGISYSHPKGDKLAMFMKMTSDQVLALSAFYIGLSEREVGIVRSEDRVFRDVETSLPFTRLPVPNYLFGAFSSYGTVVEDFFQDLVMEHQRMQAMLQTLIDDSDDPSDPKVNKYKELLKISIYG